MLGQTAIEGNGIAALCCARLLAASGQDVSFCDTGKTDDPVLLVNKSTQSLLADVFGHPEDLFSGFPVIGQRIVKWGNATQPKILAHTGIVVSERKLLERLRQRIDAPGPASIGSANWRILSVPQTCPGNEQHIGSRRASAVPVRCRSGCPEDACFIEAVESGWLFMLPCGGGKASLLVVGEDPEEIVDRSALITNQLDSRSGVPREFLAHPRILDPLCGDGWLACGRGAMSFDPICGEGVGHSVREAILASAVIRFIFKGGSAVQALNHYSSRLLSGFLRHLQLSGEYYGGLNLGDWWISQQSELDLGIKWVQNRLGNLPPSGCRLIGFELQTI